jgi:putative transport protein
MEIVDKLFDAAPLLALFITIALGYFVGKFKVGRFVLGGIAGTLLVGVAIGQFGIEIDSNIKTVFFALFIYAVGYQGGPQFFHALNRQSLNELASAFFMCLVGLFCVLLAAWAFDLDRGTAAGLAAGGLTQSAIIGTAGGTIAKLGLTPEVTKIIDTNIAVGYAVTYIFGSLGPIIMVTWFFPMVMKWDVRQEAIKRAKELSGGHPDLEPGQFNAVRKVVTRFYQISVESLAVGKSALDIDKALSDAAVEAVVREGKALEFSEDTVVQVDDQVAVTGLISVMETAADFFGPEVTSPTGFEFVEESRDIVLTKKILLVGRHKQFMTPSVWSFATACFSALPGASVETCPCCPNLSCGAATNCATWERPRISTGSNPSWATRSLQRPSPISCSSASALRSGFSSA